MSGMPNWFFWPLKNPFKKEEVPDIQSVTPPATTLTELPKTEIPTVPTTTEDVAAVTAEEKKKLTQGRTKRGTLLTGPQGILTPSNVGIKNLLGE